jgi:RimJ/RimL family protein N-acetyltransferase
MELKNIVTDRLILVPVTLEIVRSLMEGSTEEVGRLGIVTDGTWPHKDTYDILPIIYKTLERDKVPSGFEFWMVVKKDDMKVIGDIGFHGKPDEKGEVEIGFGFVEQERGKGYGYEALRAMMDWTISRENVRVIKADCLVDNRASARILEKAGMKEIGRDDELIYWEYVKP